LKPIADNSTLQEKDFIDWGQEEKFKPEIGVGECAGVVIDLVATLFYEAEEKLAWSVEAFSNEQFGDSIYHSYAAFISGAKALLLDKQVHVNTHHALINDFDKYFIETGEINLAGSFRELVLQINKQEASKIFAEGFFLSANEFLKQVKTYRSKSKEEISKLN
jgi:sulfite reductase (ferredoxin)